MKNLAQLKPESPFYHLFPQGVPIKNIMLPNKVILQGVSDEQPVDVYMIDLDQLTPEKFEELFEIVRAQCDPAGLVPRVVVWQEIKARGLPLRASQVTSVSSDVPFFL